MHHYFLFLISHFSSLIKHQSFSIIKHPQRQTTLDSYTTAMQETQSSDTTARITT